MKIVDKSLESFSGKLENESKKSGILNKSRNQISVDANMSKKNMKVRFRIFGRPKKSEYRFRCSRYN